MKKLVLPSNVTRLEATKVVDNYRRSSLLKFVLFIILASLCGTGGLACIIVGAINPNGDYLGSVLLALGFISFFLLCVPLVFFAIKVNENFKSEAFSLLYKHYEERLYQDLSCQYALTKEDLKKNFYFPSERKIDEDNARYQHGSYKNVTFASVSYDFVVQKLNHPEAHYGTYYEFNFSHSFKAPLLINSKGGFTFKKNHYPVAINSESILFNNHFVASSSDATLGTLMLSPSFAMSLLHYEEKVDDHISVLFLENHVLVYKESKDEPIISLSHKIEEKTLDAIEQEVSFYKDFAEIILTQVPC